MDGLDLANITDTTIVAGGLFVHLPATTFNAVVLGLGIYFMLGMVGTEVTGLRVPYSKFASEDERAKAPGFWQKLGAYQLNPKLGMFLLYLVPLVLYLALFFYYTSVNLANKDYGEDGLIAPSPNYSIALCVGWSFSFTKRCLEVLFLHDYSGKMPAFATFIVGFGYTAFGLLALMASNQVGGYDEDESTAVKDIICIIVFFIGMAVNFYSHVTLKLARRNVVINDDGKKLYKSPAELGMLFRIFICPHYIFEMFSFVAWGIYGGTAMHWVFAATDIGYMILRTRATYHWYLKRGLIGDGSGKVVDNDNVVPSSDDDVDGGKHNSREVGDSL